MGVNFYLSIRGKDFILFCYLSYWYYVDTEQILLPLFLWMSAVALLVSVGIVSKTYYHQN